jgi:hypothetical protein
MIRDELFRRGWIGKSWNAVCVVPATFPPTQAQPEQNQHCPAATEKIVSFRIHD